MRLATSRPELERWLVSAAFNADYRFRLRGTGAGECTIEVPFRDEFEHPGGTISGPVFMAAADVAIWFAIVTRLGADETRVTVDPDWPLPGHENFVGPMRCGFQARRSGDRG